MPCPKDSGSLRIRRKRSNYKLDQKTNLALPTSKIPAINQKLPIVRERTGSKSTSSSLTLDHRSESLRSFQLGPGTYRNAERAGRVKYLSYPWIVVFLGEVPPQDA
jgi:hypothetical protein